VSQPLPAAPNGTLPCHHGASNSGQKALYRSYTLRSILKNGLDLIDEQPSDERQLEMPLHENVRGEEYFH